ncbi:MAG: DUF4112 domain-containing protein [Prevotella sp.]|nr:DUF4112 domain-containing protein [Prevotella sp.]MBR1462990.1 DUF4112 domain-containing protein [Prevotella sp.]
MNEDKRRKTKERLEQSRMYGWLQRASDVMDRYYLDAALGFAIPGGIGDALAALISLVYVGFTAFKIRSFPLTLAVINNTLRDVLLGMIPFYVGDIIDVFHRSNQQNMQLIRGFVEGEPETINAVNRKATYSIVLFVSLCIMIYFMVKLVIWAGQQIFSLF